MSAPRRLLLQVDGTPGFPARGFAGLGVVVREPGGALLQLRSLRAPASSNNEAEYRALIAGLALVRREFPAARLRCLTDSRVVVDQLAGRAAVRAEGLRPLFTEAQALIQQIGPQLVELVAIPRELNRLADALAWEALGGRQSLVRFSS